MNAVSSSTTDKTEFCRGVLNMADGLKSMSIMEMHCLTTLVKAKLETGKFMLFEMLRRI